jgi:NADH dehydrogenase (ubiquinone) Fe-S protein 1
MLQALHSAKKPLIVVGSSTLQRPDGAAIHRTVANIAQTARERCGCGEDWRVLNVLHRVMLSTLNRLAF